MLEEPRIGQLEHVAAAREHVDMGHFVDDAGEVLLRHRIVVVPLEIQAPHERAAAPLRRLELDPGEDEAARVGERRRLHLGSAPEIVAGEERAAQPDEHDETGECATATAPETDHEPFPTRSSRSSCAGSYPGATSSARSTVRRARSG